MMTVAILLTPLDMVLNDALKMAAMKRPAKPGSCLDVSITYKGYNCPTKKNTSSALYPFIVLPDLFLK